jgi:TetR/AcrR family transcriptional regulator, transcriptional repressor for nem operon
LPKRAEIDTRRSTNDLQEVYLDNIMPRKRENLKVKVSKRDLVIDVSRRLFQRQGYGVTSVDVICDTAGVTKGAFYYYFDSKAALAIALLDEERRRVSERFQEVLDAPGSAEDKLREHLNRTCEEQSAAHKREGWVPGPFTTSLGSEVGALEPEIRQAVSQARREFGDQLHQLLAMMAVEGRASVKSIQRRVEMIAALSAGVLLIARIENDLIHLDGLIETAMLIARSDIA